MLISALKRILSVLIIISSVIQLMGVNLAFADTTKDPFKLIYISEFDGDNYYLPANFSYRDGFGTDTSTGHYLAWKNVDFYEAPSTVELSYATSHAGAIAELRLDSASGPLIATFAPEKTGNMFVEGRITASIDEEVRGIHDLYFVWKTNYLNIKCVQFKRYGEDKLGYSIFEGMNDEIIYEDLATNELAYQIKILNRLGMLGFIKEVKFDSKKVVTRAEFAQALCGFYTDSVDGNEEYFYDLPTKHSQAKYVNYMYQRGIIEMTADKHFRPDTIITVEQALNLIKKIYNMPKNNSKLVKQAEKNLENQIMSGVSSKRSGELTRQDLARMLSNAIEARYMTYTIIDGNEPGMNYTEGILKETREIDKTYGTVSAIPSTSLSNVESGISNGWVMIGDTLYSDPKNLAQKYLGYNSVIFFKEIDGERIVEAIYPRNSVVETVINTANDDELVSVSEKLITYYDSESKHKLTKKTLAKTVYFVYNGKAIDESIDKFIDPDDFRGKIRIIDNNDCSVIMIDEYQNALLKCIDSSAAKYLDEITDTVFDFSDVNTTIYKDSRAIVSSDIPANSPAFIYRSKNTIGTPITRVVILPEKKITGIVDSVYEDTITIDSEEYKIARENKNEYSFGVYNSFIINTFNEVIWSESEAADDLALGIFVGYYPADDEEGAVDVKLFTNEGIVERFTCSEKVVLDGVSRKDNKNLISGKDSYKGLADVEKRTPVMYMINEDKQLVILDTAIEGRKSRYDNLVKVGPESKFRFSNHSRILIDYTTGRGQVPFETNSKLISLWAGIDDTGDLIESFTNQIASVQAPTGQAYSTSGNEKIANVFVWKDRIQADTGAKDTDFILVDKVINVVDEEGDPTRAISGYIGAQKVTRYISDQASVDMEKINKTLDTLERGDYVYMSSDPEKRITELSVNYFHDGVSSRNGISSVLFNDNGGSYRITHDHWMSGLRTLCKVIDIEDKYIFVRIGEGDAAEEEVYTLVDYTVLKVHHGIIETGLTVKEVFNSEVNGANAVLMVSEGRVKHIIIYE